MMTLENSNHGASWRTRTSHQNEWNPPLDQQVPGSSPGRRTACYS
jgi:hypothetical protein